MASTVPRDAIVMVLDVGQSVSVLHDYEENTFFQSARSCASWIIQRKIISQSVDVLSLLLIGSKDSGLPLVCDGYNNICVKFDFQNASWDMLHFIENEVKTSNVESDWQGALIASTEMLKVYEEYNNVSNKKIVIFSDFTKPITAGLDGIIRRIKALNVEVTIIGPEHLHFSADLDDGEPEVKRKKIHKSMERQEGERVAYHFWRELPENVCICTFDLALKQLCSYAPRSKRVTPWHCIMDIGDVNINISVVKKTDPKQPKKFDTKYVKPSEGSSLQTAPTTRDTVTYYKHDTGEVNEFVDVEVKPDDTVEGYRYGKTVVPFTEEDKTAMRYETGDKCFSVIGFTPVSKVPYYLLSGECSYLVIPKDKDKNAEVALSALTQALKRTKCLAFVRRVYRHNSGLCLGVLYPTVEEIFSDETNDVTCREYLLFIELAFEEDVKSVDFPSLECIANNITQKQYDAVDMLIDGMNLMKADKGLRGEACEAFDLTFLHDYKEQFFHYCVIQKGLHPDEPLPNLLPPYIENFIKVPKSLEEKCGTAFTNIKTEFKIEKCLDFGKPWKWREHAAFALLDFRVEHFTESFISEEKDPIKRSWMRLFRRDFPTEDELEDLFDAFTNARESDISYGSKCFGLVISQVRTNHVKRDPNAYNTWMIGFKQYLSGKIGLGPAIWEVIVSGQLGLIRNEENVNSKCCDEEAQKFLSLELSTLWPPETRAVDLPLLDELIKEQMSADFDS